MADAHAYGPDAWPGPRLVRGSGVPPTPDELPLVCPTSLLSSTSRGRVELTRNLPPAVQSDLRSGAWDRAHGHLRSKSELDVGLRLTVTEFDWQ